MKREWMLRFAPIAVAAVLAAGCDGGGTGPDDALEEFDDEAMTAAVQSSVAPMSESTDANANLSSFFLQVLTGSAMDPAAAATAATGTRLHPLGPDARLRVPVERAGLDALVHHTALAATFEIPTGIRGSTFVWNPETRAWEADPALEGAPANGVRVLWYEVSDVTGEPVTPLAPQGHVDLTEEELETLDALGVLIVRTTGGATTTLADFTYAYGDTDTETNWTETLLVTGLFSDGSAQVDFDIGIEGGGSYETGDDSYQYTIALDGPDGRYDWSLVSSLDGATGEFLDALDAVITRGDVVTALDLELTGLADGSTAGEGTGQLSHLGAVVADIAVSGNDFSFTRPDGGSFTATQEQQLYGVVVAMYLYAPLTVLPFFFFYY